MRAVLFAFVLSLYAAPVSAQTNPVPASQPFTVAWDANPAAQSVTAYRCYVDKAKVGADIPASATPSCAVPGQTAGSHDVAISAVNAFGEGPRATLTVTAGTPPSAPTNLRIVVQIAVQPSGEVTLLAASVNKE